MSTLNDIFDLCEKHGVMIATAESCTGGMLSAAITDKPGSSKVLERGFVTYSNEAKVEQLGVPVAMIIEHGAVSEQVARAMAEGAVAHSRAQIAVSITGVAGPGGSDEKPEGLVWFGLKFGEQTQTQRQNFGEIGRENVRRASVAHALDMISTALATV